MHSTLWYVDSASFRENYSSSIRCNYVPHLVTDILTNKTSEHCRINIPLSVKGEEKFLGNKLVIIPDANLEVRDRNMTRRS